MAAFILNHYNHYFCEDDYSLEVPNDRSCLSKEFTPVILDARAGEGSGGSGTGLDGRPSPTSRSCRGSVTRSVISGSLGTPFVKQSESEDQQTFETANT